MRTHKTLAAWRLAREGTRHAIRLHARCRTPPAAVLLNQLARAALSAQLNIAEGYALWSTGKFLHHLRIAYGSAVEAHEVLELLLDEGLAAEDELRPMLVANVDCQRSLMGLIRKLQR